MALAPKLLPEVFQGWLQVILKMAAIHWCATSTIVCFSRRCHASILNV